MQTIESLTTLADAVKAAAAEFNAATEAATAAGINVDARVNYAPPPTYVDGVAPATYAAPKATGIVVSTSIPL